MKAQSTILAAIAALLLSLAASAAGDDSLVEVVAIGMGTTQDAAIKAANIAAVQQVVGTIVDATTLVENNELVDDKILTYSAGLIADSKIIGTPKKSADGLVTVKVKATVKKTALREKLVAAKIVSVELDGQSLWAQAVSAQDNLADAEAMIEDVLARHIACVIAEPIPGKTGKSPLDYDPKTGEVFANVRVRIDMENYSQFVTEVLDKLGPIAKNKLNLISGGRSSGYKYAGDGFINYDIPYGKLGDNFLVVMTSFRSGAATVLFFDKNEMRAIQEAIDTGSLAAIVSLKDLMGKELSQGRIITDSRYQDRHKNTQKPSIFAMYNTYCTGGVIVPMFGGDILGAFGRCGQLNSIPAKTEETFRVSLGFFPPKNSRPLANLKSRSDIGRTVSLSNRSNQL